jgi:glutamyl-tRNA synthetase
MAVVTRFAPSPTGYLHIGGARTALFNWLYARHHGGEFLLRIEDTDRTRSTADAVDAILGGLTWLGLHWDGAAISQFARADRHAEAAHRLLAQGRAYRCYATPEELAAMREEARRDGRPMLYDGRWRDRDPAAGHPDVAPTIRFRAPRGGVTRIDDLVQGSVSVANDQLDDMVLLRADGTPTYMLAVVVDDHDMAVTHVIRGDDHLTNAFRQTQLYLAFGWTPPAFAHLPLLHGADGAKLSKRHGALAVQAYQDMGVLPEAMCNYLLRLGWSHGDDEIISREQAVGWFDLPAVGRSPARFDMARLLNLNAHYLRQADTRRLIEPVLARLRADLGDRLTETAGERLAAGLEGLKARSKTIVELAEKSRFYALKRPLALAPAAAALMTAEARAQLSDLTPVLRHLTHWSANSLEATVREFAEGARPRSLKLGEIAQPLRAALTGSSASPPIFEVMEVLGREETVGRIADVLEGREPAAAVGLRP